MPTRFLAVPISRSLIYPAYLASADKLSPDVNITPRNAARTFLVQTEDDKIGIENCPLLLPSALKANRVPAEMHLFPTGGHGYGLGVNGGEVATWPALCGRWLQEMKLTQ